MTKISDIAELAQVSESAVSFALNNKPGVSDEKRQQILKIAKDLNFTPRRKSSRNANIGRIGFVQITRHGNILNRDHDAFIADYIYGISQSCKESRFEFDLVNFDKFNAKEISNLDNGQFRGLIILGTELSADDIRQFDNFTTPIVFLDTYYRYVKHNFVTMNNFDAIYDIVKHLVGQGLKNIEFISTDEICANIQEREVGFRLVSEDLKLPNLQPIVHKMPSTYDGAYISMCELLDEGYQLPDAFLCANDVMAMGCMKALSAHGIDVPGTISITGFDDLPSSARSEPPLTCYQVPKHEIGRSGAELLFEAIKREGEDFSTIKIRVDGDLVVRNTTAIKQAHQV